MGNLADEVLLTISRKAVGKGMGSRYGGHGHVNYEIDNPGLHDIANTWSKEHGDISFAELVPVLDELSSGKSYQEKAIVGMILGRFSKFRKQIDPAMVDRWLLGREGWAEVDSLCQGVFSAEEMLSSWSLWKKWLLKWAGDADIHKRRASLVLLTGPVAHSCDERLFEAGFSNIERLKGEKDILITKAISWLLRSMVRSNPETVREYLARNRDTLPAVAVRETLNKLKSGRKSGH